MGELIDYKDFYNRVKDMPADKLDKKALLAFKLIEWKWNEEAAQNDYMGKD
jgi:hypothetical protein